MSAPLKPLANLFCCLGLLLGSCGQSDATSSPKSADSDRSVKSQPELVENFEAVLNEYLALNQRLENVGYRILRGNVDQCPETKRDVGLKIHTIFDYPEDLQMPARVFLNLDIDPAIRVIAADSPAQNAGLRIGDRVKTLGDYDIPSGRTAVQLFEAVASREFRLASSVLQVERGGELVDASLAPEPICGYPTQLFYSELMNAHTNGDEIWVTSELIRQLKDDESLGLVIAHELAHVTEGHLMRQPTKALELEADRLSVIYLRNAGYDPALAIERWKANPHNHMKEKSESHPSFSERLNALETSLETSD